MMPDLDKHKVLLTIGVICLFALSIIIAVILLTPKSSQCISGGAIYPNGSNFISDDGCNTCSCSNGEAICTDMACDPGVVVDPSEPALPMKGIEVYCWEQGSATYYSILPGTNRVKTYIEVTDPKYSYSQDSGTEFQFIKVTESEAKQFLEVQVGLDQDQIKEMITNCVSADTLL